MSKPTPYQRLRANVDEYVRKVSNPRRIGMWTYPKTRINEAWTLGDLYERVRAADQLGYDVQLIANDAGLLVQYVQKRPSTLGLF